MNFCALMVMVKARKKKSKEWRKEGEQEREVTVAAIGFKSARVLLLTVPGGI